MGIRIAGMNSGMDTDAMVQDLVKAYKTKGDKNVKQKKRLELKQEAWNDLNKKIKSFQSKYVNNMKFSSYYSKKSTTVSDTTKATVVTSDNAANGTQSLEVLELAKAGYLTGSKLAAGTTSASTLKDLGFDDSTTITLTKGQGTASEETISIDVTADTKISDFVGYVSAAGLNANFDEANGRLFISSKESGTENDFSFTADKPGVLGALGITGGDSHKVVAGDAKIKLNGVEYTSSSNAFSINGLTITAKEKTNGEISIATDTDYEGIYDSIKSFIMDYSELINEMDKLYNGNANKGYDPLTDEEKEELSESEIKKWEDKVQESLLRRDADLSSISNIMKNAMLSVYEVDGKEYSLSSFGIHTMGYFESADNERNAYHIDGNSDDSATAANADKLKAAIAADPAAVSGFFSKLATAMSDKMTSLTASTSNRSYGSFFEDKKMKADVTSWESKIAKWEDYVKSIEDRYYSQFTKMEKAMATLNSQQSYLSGLFG